MAAEAWTRVLVAVPGGWEELVADVLARSTGTTVAFGAPSGATPEAPPGATWLHGYMPAREDDPSRRAEVGDALAELAAATGEPELAGLVPLFKALPPEDYASSWRKTWRPFRVGRLAVVTPGYDGPLRDSDVRLDLELGSAFGTGRHVTTRSCLRAIQARLSPGERVLDAGAGSGILSVAAVLLGASSALGFDVDPNACPQAEGLATSNGVGDRCEFRAGDFSVLGQGDTRFDAALANIYADVLQAHAADLAARVRAGGWFALSGCRHDHRDATVPVLAAAGLAVEDEVRHGDWCTFVGSVD